MKQFFGVLFGGLIAIGAGVGLAYGSLIVWKVAKPHLAWFTSASSSASATTAEDARDLDDGTSISGSRRTIRYTASEEEDLFTAAAQSLAAGADGRVTAGSYLVKNLTTGITTTERDADKLLPIASLTKLATAVVARKLIDADDRITVGPKIMATYGNTAGFRAGETFKASDLMYPLLMVSSNDSAEAFALAYDRPRFIKAMNEWAQSIGAYRTYFADASGLSADNISTANDLAIMLDWIRENDPTILDITLMKSKTLRSHTWINPTHFLSWSYYLGGKNGYTTEANRTSASLFALGPNKNVYAIVVLGSGNRDADMIKLLEKVRE
ncbi:MAG: D-alanyl-D-alanine carboxypeptidase [Candidatus Pacebacteria bacterium]|nr:D-alanyl-D-alanine carboxypeptidase [Candidatus Paceibacterota bacterium]